MAEGERKALIERARALTPLLAAKAEEAEELRRPADAVIEALSEARIFELMVPECYGGLGLDLDSFLEVGLALAEGDASMAWVATFLIEHNWLFCQFPASFQRALYAERRAVLAPAMVAPTGTATSEGEGFRISGRWQWATGVMHSSWVMVASLSKADDGSMDPRFFALPIDEVKVEDTWYVDGMCATGSQDVVIDEVWVPAERTLSLLELGRGTAPGATLHATPLYRTPLMPVLALAATLPALGQARTAVRGYRERLQERTAYMSSEKLAEKAAAQIRLGRVELAVQQAELLLRDVVSEVMARRNEATVEARARWIAAYSTVVHQSRDAVQEIALASGASAHFRSHPLQRAVRDLNTLSCHAAFALDDHLQSYGRTRLGMDPVSPFL